MDTKMLAKQQKHPLIFCVNTGYRQNDLPRAISDGDKWRESIKGIHTTSMP